MAKITIFGLSGSGKTTIAKLLAEKLSLKYISTGQFIRNKAQELGLSLGDFKELRKKDPKYDFELDEDTKKYAQNNDNFVFESRLAWYFISDSFKIKLACEPDVRIERICKREGSTFEKQKEITDNRDKSDNELYKSLYGIENMDADEHFDFIIDVTKITPSEIVKKIISVIY